MSISKYVFYHKQKTSGRMRFLLFDQGSVLSGDPLPDLAVVEEDFNDDPEDTFENEIDGSALDLMKPFEKDKRDLDQRFNHVCTIDQSGEQIIVKGIQFTEIDPPFDQVAEQGAKFIEMMQARQLSPIDAEILRRVYVLEMGGG